MVKQLFLVMSFSVGIAYAQTETDTIKVPQSDELRENQLIFDEAPVVSLDDNDVSQGISSQLTAGRDPFFSSATFNWGAARFRIRGYDNNSFVTYMNGVPMDGLDNGNSSFFLWSGLNDVLRNRESSLGLRPTTYTFGEVGGQFNIDTRASKQWKQLRVGYASTNRNYRNRLMATYNTGLTKSGWAFSLSGSRRWAKEGYVPGTFYDGWSYFASAEKIFNQKHSLALTTFGAPTKSGGSGGVVQELYDLAGTHYYNPYWGYQEGKKRNSRVNLSHQPTFILTHEYSPSNKLNILSAVSYTFGIRKQSGLDWYNVSDPRPEYYRNLPSYLLNEEYRNIWIDRIKENPEMIQVDWARMYDVNQNNIETIKDVDGISGNDVTGHRSRYIIEQRITKVQRANLNTIINATLNENLSFTGGLSYQYLKNRLYKEIGDLLGGEFYVNLNQFAERDFPGSNANQNDLNRPNQILKEGDKYGYDYEMIFNKASAWGQISGTWSHVDAFLSTELSFTNYYRNGLNRNGLFQDNSFGKSDKQKFFNFGVKGGATYKINGRNYIYANGSYSTKAPYFNDVFVSPRTRNSTVSNPENEKIASVESGYVLNTPRVKARLTGYFTKFDNQSRTMTFYHDDYRNFVNYSLTNIDKIHFGGELGVEAKIYKGFSMTLAAAMGRYFNTSRQNAEVTLDNSSEILQNELIYSKYFKEGGTPQTAATLGFNYRSPKYWFASVNLNYFDDMWLDYNPLRRTWAAVEELPNPSDTYDQVVQQERLKAQLTLDFFGGYSWKLDKTFKNMKKAHYIYLNVGVNNITNNKNLITGGYEQLRYDFENANVNKFPSRYFYAYGTNYFINITYKL
ncbi:MAG: TonB-dependent receptor [Chitinophagales bacterium]|nr:TonB-dependent receptor [Chitinophagales bacterium]MCZ2394318.1 TonB-dependent receptor [Chitinophagales bacterium]